MPMDALCLSAVLAETERNILGGRIDKIHQPSRDEILLHIRGRNGPCRLLLSPDMRSLNFLLRKLGVADG